MLNKRSNLEKKDKQLNKQVEFFFKSNSLNRIAIRERCSTHDIQKATHNFQ